MQLQNIFWVAFEQVVRFSIELVSVSAVMLVQLDTDLVLLALKEFFCVVWVVYADGYVPTNKIVVSGFVLVPLILEK